MVPLGVMNTAVGLVIFGVRNGDVRGVVWDLTGVQVRKGRGKHEEFMEIDEGRSVLGRIVVIEL